MLVDVIKYVLNTDMKTIRKDVSEYEQLSKKCERLRRLRNLKYKELNGDKGCIAHKLRTESVGVSLNNSDVSILEYDLETFSECKNLKDSLCAYNACPFFDKNKNYIAALMNYKDAMKSKKNYWNKKFTRSK